MENKHRAIVVGCGRIGAQSELDERRDKPATHLGVYRRCKYTELVGLVDTDKEKLAAAKSQIDDNIATFNDVVTAIDKLRPDIVSVATTSSSHKDVVKAAAAKKTPLIMCEKPIAETIEDAEEMVAACNESGSILIVNHMRRFDPALSRVADMILKKKIGDIQSVRCLYVNGLMNTGSHIIDMLHWYFGEIKWVLAVPNGQEPTYGKDVLVNAIIEFESGVQATLQSLDSKHYAVFEIEVFGKTGKISITGLGQIIDVIGLRESMQYRTYMELNPEKVERIADEGRSFFSSMAEHLVSVLDGASPKSTGKNALQALKVLLALKKSAEKGTKEFV